MVYVEGSATRAKILTDDAEDYAKAQIKQICDLEWAKDYHIVCMPDIHPGKVSTIGFTCTQPYTAPIMPGLVGNDIGCGITMARIRMRKKPEWKKLDVFIRDNIPVGDNKRKEIHPSYYTWYRMRGDMIRAKIDFVRIAYSLGTLGGGNHFIEIDKDEDDFYITVHSGSRSLGSRVYEYWQDQADLETNGNGIGRTVPRELTYLSDINSKRNYMEDVAGCIEFAIENRMTIIKDICKAMKWEIIDIYTTWHNFIEDNYNMYDPDNTTNYTIRKGAIRALAYDPIIIPINIRDGIIFGKAKNPSEENNYSAPHGAGRILSRKAVMESHTMKEYRTAVHGVYSPTITKDTLDEAPFAYRSLEDIRGAIEEFIEIEKILKPVYNYKGGH